MIWDYTVCHGLSYGTPGIDGISLYRSADQAHYYCKDPKFLDRHVCANSVDPDQTAWSILSAIQNASFGHHYSMVKPLC